MQRLLSASLLLTVLFLNAPSYAQSTELSDDTVIIENTGSTNFSGYKMVVAPSGEVTVTSFGRISPMGHQVFTQGLYHLPQASARKLLGDLNSALPFSGAPGSCVKSVSFGTATYVIFKGQKSPDIQCLRNGPQYVQDVFNIQRAIARPPGSHM